MKQTVGTQFTGYDGTCHCRIDRNGKPIGMCLRCTKIYGRGIDYGRRKERARIKAYLKKQGLAPNLRD